MYIVSGPVGTLLIALLAIVGLVLWLRRDRRYPGPKLHGVTDEIDREELEEAEREVKDLDSSQRPEDGFQGDDWGPGAGGRRSGGR